MEEITKQIGETTYVLKLFPTMLGLSIINRLQAAGAHTEEIILDVVTKGATIGSVTIDRKKFDKHFQGKYKELIELFGEILIHNKLFPDVEVEGEEGNEEDSENQ